MANPPPMLPGLGFPVDSKIDLLRKWTWNTWLWAQEDFQPSDIPGLALWLDAIDQNSLLASNGSVVADGGEVALVSEKSGNSTENCLVLNGVTGNYASTTKYIPTGGVFRIEADITSNNYTQGDQAIASVYNNVGNQRSWRFIINGSGFLRLNLSADGFTVNVGEDSGVAVPSSAGQRLRARVDVDLDSGTIDFFTSDGGTWTQLGVRKSFTPIALFSSSSDLILGAQNSGTLTFLEGSVHSVRLYQDGVQVRGFDATASAKLAASVPDEVSGTWTINSTGATGARISGARDPYQGTVANRGVYSVAERSITTDGVNDYLKTAPFSHSQPTTVYAAMQQVTWTSGNYLFDGNTADTLALIQTTSTPQLNISAGNSVAANTDLAVATKGVVSMVINGASSSLRVNRNTATTGNAGAGVANGLTIGAKADGSAPGNAKYHEILVYSGAHDAATRDRITLYLARKWGIAV